MVLKCEDRALHALFSGLRGRRLDKRTVSSVDAVKIAQRHHGRICILDFLQTVKNNHLKNTLSAVSTPLTGFLTAVPINVLSGAYIL